MARAALRARGCAGELLTSRPAKRTVATRQSRGLEQFFTYIRDQAGLTILDLGGASQANVSFITSLGHRLYSVDFLRSMQETFGERGSPTSPTRDASTTSCARTWTTRDETFDGVLVWDMLEYMAPAAAGGDPRPPVQRITRPGSYLLAFFHSDERATSVPYYTFRIQDFNQLQVAAQGAASRRNCSTTARWRNCSSGSIR